MSVSPIVTRGYSFAIALLPTAGYLAGAPAPEVPIVESARTGGAHHQRKRRHDHDDERKLPPIAPIIESPDLADRLYSPESVGLSTETPVIVNHVVVNPVADVRNELARLTQLAAAMDRERAVQKASDAEKQKARVKARMALLQRQRDEDELILMDWI